MRVLLLVLLSALLTGLVLAASPDLHGGVWTAELRDDHTTLQMTTFQGRGHKDGGSWSNTMGFDLPATGLHGLAIADIESSAANVTFELTRAAGTLHFEGRFASGVGAGSFRFVPSEAFIKEMDGLGFRGFREDELLMFTVHDFVPQTVRDLRAAGFEPSRKQLVEAAIFRVNGELLRDYARLGYPKLTFRELINFRVGKVDAAFITGMRELGYANLAPGELANAAILGVTPEWVRAIQSAGMTGLSLRELTNLRIGGIDAKRVEEYRRLGYHLTPRQLGDFGIHNIRPEWIEQLRALGYRDLTPGQLVEMKIFGVTPEYIRKLQAAGYERVPVDKLLKLKMSGADEFLSAKK